MDGDAAHKLADELTRRRDEIARLRVFVGFDGFVDSICRVVSTRDADGPRRWMSSKAEFAALLESKGGASANAELDERVVKVGGNGPICAGALAALGMRVTCVGPVAGPVFDGLRASCERVVETGPPGETTALEFDDGKIMLGRAGAMDRVTWAGVVEAAGGVGPLREMVERATLVLLGNWTMLPHANALWRGMRDEVFAHIEGERRVMVDLSDPAKRSDAELREACEILRGIDAHAPVTLGLNRAEAARLSRVSGSGGSAREIRGALGISCVMVHGREGADGCDESCGGEGEARATREPIDAPAISTGAGDHFNAGCMLGAGLGLPLDSRLSLGLAVAGWYVRRGAPPTLDDLIGFVRAG